MRVLVASLCGAVLLVACGPAPDPVRNEATLVALARAEGGLGQYVPPGGSTEPPAPPSGRRGLHLPSTPASPGPAGQDRFDCADFASQAGAQAVLRADPADPHGLDPDRDGVACPDSPAPHDAVPVRRSATPPAPRRATD